jgi:uncharacterized protein YfaQ (DUF2300 family)
MVHSLARDVKWAESDSEVKDRTSHYLCVAPSSVQVYCARGPEEESNPKAEVRNQSASRDHEYK